MKTLKSRLLTYLERNGGWIAGAELEKKMIENGSTGSTCTRYLREFVTEGKAEVDHRGRTGHSFYRAKNYKPVQTGYLDEEKGVYVMKRV
jgi:hypothetical protein